MYRPRSCRQRGHLPPQPNVTSTHQAGHVSSAAVQQNIHLHKNKGINTWQRGNDEQRTVLPAESQNFRTGSDTSDRSAERKHRGELPHLYPVPPTLGGYYWRSINDPDTKGFCCYKQIKVIAINYTLFWKNT